MAVVLYLSYLFLPILLLAIGSFGQSWTNALLPTGITLEWFKAVAGDASSRRAFVVSLEVVTATGVACTAIALPIAYAMYRSAAGGLRAKESPRGASDMWRHEGSIATSMRLPRRPFRTGCSGRAGWNERAS
jgi:ABC-type sugar transport system permease subunit